MLNLKIIMPSHAQIDYRESFNIAQTKNKTFQNNFSMTKPLKNDVFQLTFKGGANELVFPTVKDILKIHKKIIKICGGAGGIRDLEALESAVFRPQTGYYKDAIETGAALLESLSQNHPFVDGNKKTAIEATFDFLKKNNYQPKITPIEAFDEIKNLYKTNSCDFEHIDEVIRTKIL